MLSYSAWADDLKGCYVQIKEYRKFEPGSKQYEWVWYKNIKNTVITQEKILKEIPV